MSGHVGLDKFGGPVPAVAAARDARRYGERRAKVTGISWVDRSGRGGGTTDLTGGAQRDGLGVTVGRPGTPGGPSGVVGVGETSGWPGAPGVLGRPGRVVGLGLTVGWPGTPGRPGVIDGVTWAPPGLGSTVGTVVGEDGVG
ncbi:hypothetical protein DLJ58_04610, partial [Micromonospora arida]